MFLDYETRSSNLHENLFKRISGLDQLDTNSTEKGRPGAASERGQESDPIQAWPASFAVPLPMPESHRRPIASLRKILNRGTICNQLTSKPNPFGLDTHPSNAGTKCSGVEEQRQEQSAMLGSLRSSMKFIGVAALSLEASMPISAQEGSKVSIPSGPVATRNGAGVVPIPGIIGPSGAGVPIPARAVAGKNTPQAQPQPAASIPTPSPSPKSIR